MTFVMRLLMCWGRRGRTLEKIVELQVAVTVALAEVYRSRSKIVRGSLIGSNPVGEQSAHLTQQSHSTGGNTVTLGNESSNRITTAEIFWAEILGRLSGESAVKRKELSATVER